MKPLFTVLLFFIIQISFSQIIEFPRITSQINSNEDPIQLSELKVSVFVVENIATTTFEMNFYNSNNRVMEGELNFPLPNGTTVSRFALDVNGEMREGVVVEKEKATQVFETIIRQQIDPGLVEVTKGNNFKARVYPIPARGNKKALVAFEQELNSDEESFLYQLPFNLKEKLKHFSIQVEVVKNRPHFFKSNHPTINLEFKEERNSYISHYEESDVVLDKLLAFSIPKPTELKEVGTYKGNITSDNFFYINLNLKKEEGEKDKPKSLTIVWDQSSSAKRRMLDKEIDFLKQYFEWCSASEIKLITFSNTTHLEKTFTNTDELIEKIKSLKYDGGTNLSSIDFSKISSDEIILFTDAISNFGVKKQLKFSSPVLAVNSSSMSDHNLMEFITSSSGGQYIDLLKLSLEEAKRIASHQQKRFLGAKYNHSSIKELYPNVGQTINGSFGCSGILEGEKQDITLLFGFGEEPTESYTITIDNSKSVDNKIGERIWAQKKLKTLQVLGDKKVINEHGKKFSLVTPGTSLIVLDDVNDYVRYEIPPPASLRERYDAIITFNLNKAENNQKRRIKSICQAFEHDYRWWTDSKLFTEKEKNESSDALTDTIYELNERELDVRGGIRTKSATFIDGVMVQSDMEMEVFEEAGFEPSTQLLSLHKDGINSKSASKATLNVNSWDSNAKYINTLKSVDPESLYEKYLELKITHEEDPSFYFNVATYLFQKELREEGLRVISNLAELELENAELLRALGRKLSEFKFHVEALEVFKDVMEFRSFEPHSYIDLGLEYNNLGQDQKAIENLYTVIDKSWDADIISRYNGIELIVLHDINNIIALSESQLNTTFIDDCLIKQMPNDLRIVIDWDANNTDIDLWVIDPKKEKCNYKNKQTRIGGKISNDITTGYGPEEFRLKNAIEGDYTIEVKFYRSSKQTLLNNVNVRAIIYTKFGSSNQEKQVLTLQLEPKKDGKFEVGTIAFKR